MNITRRLISLNCFKHFMYPHRLKVINIQSENMYDPSLLVSANRYEKYKSALQNFGFSDFQARRILENEPNVLKVKEEMLSSFFLNWYCIKIAEPDLLKAIASCPKLLLIDEANLKSRIGELMTIFTQKDIVKLLKTCPEVFYEDFIITMEKVQYIVHCMGIEQASIIKSGALHSNIDFVKLRHNFLFYAGKFKKPSKKVQFKNAPLNKILHKNLDVYLSLSGLTAEEYNVFSAVFEYLKLLEEDAMNEDGDLDVL